MSLGWWLGDLSAAAGLIGAGTTTYGGGADDPQQLCGQLRPHKQKWFSSLSTSVVSSRHVANLRDCIMTCCSIPDCEAITFTGFLAPANKRSAGTDNSSTTSAPPADNCLMFKCSGEIASCAVSEELAANDGVLSVQIVNRTSAPTENIENNDFTPSALPIAGTKEDGDANRTLKGSNSDPHGIILPVGHVNDDDELGKESSHPPPPVGIITGAAVFASSTEKSPSSTPSEGDPLRATRAELAPIWAIGLAIIVAIVCLGTNIALLCSYLCYRRRRVRMQGSDISRVGGLGVKAPTLHAFNPSHPPPNIQYPHRLTTT